MTEKRYSVENRWVKDNCIDNLLNINFNTITDAMMCCDLLNQLNDENEQLKQQMQTILKLTKKIEDCTYDIKIIGGYDD